MNKHIISKPILLFIFSLLTTIKINAQYSDVETIVGNGNDYGDSVNASDSSTFLPSSVVVDNSGNIYFTELTNCVVRKLDVNGIVTRIAGIPGNCSYSGDNGPATSAKLNLPSGLAIDSQNNLYIADRDNHRIRKIDSNGIITTIAGNGVEDFSGDGGQAISASFKQPREIEIDSNGNLYIVDWRNHRVRKIDTNGVITTIAGTGESESTGDGGQAVTAEIDNPSGLTVDNNGNIYFSESSNNKIRKIDASGIISTYVGVGGFRGFSGDGDQAINAKLHDPTGLAIDNDGNLYFCDRFNHRIRKVDASGIISTIAGTGNSGFSGGGYNGDGLQGTATLLKQPSDLVLDASGNIIIADYKNDRLRKLNKSTLSNNGFKLKYTSIYPNPISDGQKLNISSKNLISQIFVYNIIGQSIVKVNPESSSYQLDLNSINKGVYFLNIKNDKNETGQYKIVKQ